MSHPAPCSKATPCPKCLRLLRMMLASLVCLVVLAAVTLGVAIAESRDSSTDPKPASSPTATEPADPSPSPPTDSTPTSTMPPGPAGTACNIFDPECSIDTGDTDA
ncbi:MULTISPECIES: hypothetical protein [unclassified Streptomyces]|uniref:hypothetical protein n=1 Tax=unclassified Streptomyces TaxID=2593676 RepID=UPI00364B8483